MKNENLVCLETDKTGKFALDTRENFMNKMEKHIESDEVITEKEIKWTITTHYQNNKSRRKYRSDKKDKMKPKNKG